MSKEPLPTWGKQASEALLNSLRERDPYTYGHSLRVARYSRLLAQAAGFSKADQEAIEYAGLFHDLGKIAIPDRILLKTSSLSLEEEVIMRTHPIKSVEILTPLCAACAFFKDLLPGIRHHHEHFDGTGYPDRKKGEDIPLTSRVILVVDTFDAITTTRPYHKGISADAAYKELELNAGTQLDPHLVKVFLDSHPRWQALDQSMTEEYINTHYKKAA